MFTIVTINLHGRRERWRERRPLLVAQLLEIVPDLICLQEVHLSTGQGRWLKTQLNERLAVQAGGAKVTYQFVQKRGDFLSSTGVAILTRLPIVSHDAFPLPHGNQIALRVNVELPSRQTVDVVTTQLHLSPRAIESRAEQVTAIMGWLRANRRTRLQILAGDFNETPTGLAIQRIKQGYRSAYTVANGHEPLATYPTAVFDDDEMETAVCRDYIFLSPAIKQVQSARICCHKQADTDPDVYPSTHVGLFSEIGE